MKRSLPDILTEDEENRLLATPGAGDSLKRLRDYAIHGDRLGDSRRSLTSVTAVRDHKARCVVAPLTHTTCNH